MIDQSLKQLKQKFENILARFSEELARFQAGRANAGLVENLEISVYGSKMTIKQIANISIPDAASILIMPWDKSAVAAVEAGLRTAEINGLISADSSGVRIKLSPMTEENRIQLEKKINQLKEDVKVAMRQAREELFRQFRQDKQDALISEDEFFRGEKALNEMIREHNELIDSAAQKKVEQIKAI